jgi:hypothetical protein
MQTATLAFLALSSLLAQPAPVAPPAASGAEAAAPQPSATLPAPAPAAQCLPACRSGYLCHQGQCISACNPPCSAGEICTGSGVCQLSAPPAELSAPPAEPAAPAARRRSTYSAAAPPDPPLGPLAADGSRGPSGANLHVNALGLLQFGLIPRLEIGGSNTFLLGAHFFNTGALSYVVIPGDDEELNFSIGGNLGFRHYFSRRGGQLGGYFGAFLEYASLTMTDETDDRAKYERGLLIPAVDVGHRWVWGKFLLDLGGILGAAFVVSAKDTPIGEEGCAYVDSCLEEAETSAFGMGTLDVGFFF